MDSSVDVKWVDEMGDKLQINCEPFVYDDGDNGYALEFKVNGDLKQSIEMPVNQVLKVISMMVKATTGKNFSEDQLVWVPSEKPGDVRKKGIWTSVQSTD